jgi:hypothetical protein
MSPPSNPRLPCQTNNACKPASRMRFVVFGCMSLALISAAGCASNGPPEVAASTNGDENPLSRDQMQGAASDAARQPLRDIGLLRRKIPTALARIADPYAEPSGPGCVWITYELNQLNAALGSETAIMPVASQESSSARGSRAAGEAARDMIRSAGARLLPGRSVIRQLSGAKSADELYEAAEERGKVRRGYLKGLSEAKRCG